MAARSIASAGLGGGSDAIATGANGAGNGGSGHFSGSLIDVSVAIYAPINIAIAGPHSTVEADQINNVHFDQSAVQIAGSRWQTAATATLRWAVISPCIFCPIFT